MKTWRTLALLAPFLAGCAGLSVRRDYDPAADFGRLRTYRWKSPERAVSASADNSLMEGRVRRAVEAELAEKGFRPAEGDAPADFLATYEYAVERQEEHDRLRTGVGVGLGSGGTFGGIGVGIGGGSQNEETETLSIDVLNGADGKLLWRGFVRRPLRRRDDPDRAEQDVKAMTAAILKKFPPEAKKR